MVHRSQTWPVMSELVHADAATAEVAAAGIAKAVNQAMERLLGTAAPAASGRFTSVPVPGHRGCDTGHSGAFSPTQEPSV